MKFGKTDEFILTYIVAKRRRERKGTNKREDNNELW